MGCFNCLGVLQDLCLFCMDRCPRTRLKFSCGLVALGGGRLKWKVVLTEPSRSNSGFGARGVLKENASTSKPCKNFFPKALVRPHKPDWSQAAGSDSLRGRGRHFPAALPELCRKRHTTQEILTKPRTRSLVYSEWTVSRQGKASARRSAAP